MFGFFYFKISSKGIKEGKLGLHLEKVFFDKLDAFSGEKK
jgi:hypothetical protein